MTQAKQETVACNLCGSEEYSQRHVVRGYTIVRCDDCGLTFLNPRPVAGELATIYDTADYYGGGSEYEDVRLGYPNYLALEASAPTETARKASVTTWQRKRRSRPT